MSEQHDPDDPVRVDLDADAHEGLANILRAAVFGVQDGIVSTFGLVMGVAGARISPEAVLIAGVAGMVSGALSMGAGEYVSVRVQRELLLARGARPQRAADPVRAALANAGLFLLGGALPLLPFVLLRDLAAIATSSVVSIGSLFLAGALLTRLTGVSPVRSGLRMLVVGGGSGALGFLVGSLLGVAVG
jgi:VIT1/CCC1 family predicted Fe2+/Mn2+ transporter